MYQYAYMLCFKVKFASQGSANTIWQKEQSYTSRVHLVVHET